MSGTQQLLLGEVSGGPATYIEDVFSTYLYNGASNTALQIQNGIDLSTKGGMVWIKCRSNQVNHELFDTSRGVSSSIQSNSTNAAAATPRLGTFNTDGFTHSATPTNQNLDINETSRTFASWTFRKQPKFFDVVTYTGTGVARTISHNLGSAPGCIIIKRTDTSGYDWAVYHRSLTTPSTYKLALDTTAAQAGPNSIYWNSTDPTSTVFSLGTWGDVNASGGSYVAYLFAHNAGGFGLTGTDNVISCGSYTGTGSGSVSVTLGYEPQYLLIKQATGATLKNWWVIDNMRGMPVGGNEAILAANLSDAEVSADLVSPTATGFEATNTSQSNLSGVTYIYIAIRRGPMKVPTDGTTVFAPVSITGNSSTSRSIAMGINPDLFLFKRTSSSDPAAWTDKLRGNTRQLKSSATDAEVAQSLVATNAFENTGVSIGARTDDVNVNYSPFTYALYGFTRAPSFFDEVCYTGNGTTQNISHNLAAVPELMFIKRRNTTGYWPVYSAALGNSAILQLEDVGAVQTGASQWNSTTPTSSVFSLGSTTGANASGGTYVAYLFATCAGVSKVGSYTGNGSTQAIACGFTGGARFVLIKRTDSTGDWYVYDTARGMTTLTDPYFLLNSTAAQSATLGSVTTTTGGFTVDASILAAINTNAASYIFLAIA